MLYGHRSGVFSSMLWWCLGSLVKIYHTASCSSWRIRVELHCNLNIYSKSTTSAHSLGLDVKSCSIMLTFRQLLNNLLSLCRHHLVLHFTFDIIIGEDYITMFTFCSLDGRWPTIKVLPRTTKDARTMLVKRSSVDQPNPLFITPRNLPRTSFINRRPSSTNRNLVLLQIDQIHTIVP